MSIKMIVTDLDGTLLRTDKTVSDRTIQVLQMSLENVVAFGDDGNDLEMLQMCGVGVAVANALPEIKTAADHVTLSNDEDGVAVFLEACNILA